MGLDTIQTFSVGTCQRKLQNDQKSYQKVPYNNVHDCNIDSHSTLIILGISWTP